MDESDEAERHMMNLEYTYSIGMTDEELDDRLRDETIGVLSLASNGDSYAIPLAYHYDNETIYVRLGLHPDSKKAELITETRTACFLIYSSEPLQSSWSIIATGPVSEVDDPTLVSEEAMNSLFVPLRVFGESIDAIEPAVFALEIESLSGRRSAEA